MNNEKLVFEIVAASRSHSQKGDLSQALADQGFFDNGAKPIGLKMRDKNLTGNPVDVQDTFNKQNPN